MEWRKHRASNPPLPDNVRNEDLQASEIARALRDEEVASTTPALFQPKGRRLKGARPEQTNPMPGPCRTPQRFGRPGPESENKMILKPKDLRELETLLDSPGRFDYLDEVLQQGLRRKRFTKEDVARDLQFVLTYARAGLEILDYSTRVRALDVLEWAAPDSLDKVESYEYLMFLLEARLRDGKTREAIEAAERVLEIAPYDLRTVRLFVVAAVAEGRAQDAEDLLNEAIEFYETIREMHLSEPMFFRRLRRKLRKVLKSNRTLPEKVADLADPIIDEQDLDKLKKGAFDYYQYAEFRELTRSIMVDPEKLKKNLRILRATEPTRTPEGLHVSTSTLQIPSFTIEFNMSLATISMLDTEAVRMIARGVWSGAYGEIERVRIANPFCAEIFSKDGNRDKILLTLSLGPTCVEPLLTGYEPVWREMTEEEEDEAFDPRNCPAKGDRKGWLEHVARWTPEAGYDILAHTLEAMPGTKNIDLTIEYARVLLLTFDNFYVDAYSRKRSIGLLQELLPKVTKPSDRARVLRLLGMGYLANGSYRAGFETLLASQDYEPDSRAIYSMGRALQYATEILPRLSFEERAEIVGRTVEESEDLMVRQISLAERADVDPRLVIEGPISVFSKAWLRKVGLDEEGKPVLQLGAGNKKSELFALREFLKRMPEGITDRWTFLQSGRPEADLSTYVNPLLKEADLATLRFHPKIVNGKIRLAVAVGKKIKAKERFCAALTDAVVAAVGEAAYMTHFRPDFLLWNWCPTKKPGYSLEELRTYFFKKFPDARGMTLTDVPIGWQDLKVDCINHPGAPFFMDIREGRSLFPELFDPYIFSHSNLPGVDFTKTLEHFGATTVMIAFDIDRGPKAPKGSFGNRRREAIAEFTRALEVDGHATVVGTAVGSQRAYVTAVLWQADRALLNAGLLVKNNPSIAWALVQTLSPKTHPIVLGSNDDRALQKALVAMRIGFDGPAPDFTETMRQIGTKLAERRKIIAEEAIDYRSVIEGAIDELETAVLLLENVKKMRDGTPDSDIPAERLFTFYGGEAKA